ATEGPGAHILEVWNKIDRLPSEVRESVQRAAARNASPPALVSAVTGEGVPDLLAEIDRRLSASDVLVDVAVAPEDGRLLAWLYANAEVVRREADNDGQTHLTVRIPSEKRHRLDQQLKARS
ncbi:MAG: GTPase HflX, partial [Proteobacteria bacterium]|nr:GTPase HflX [Pseudomonadota bacterium]